MDNLSRLRIRLVLVVLIVIGPVVGLIAYQQSVERQRSRDRARDEMRRLAQMAGDQQAAVFHGVSRLLMTLSAFPGVLADDAANCQEVLQKVLRDHPDYVNIWVVNADGTQFCAATPSKRQSFVDRAWFKRVMSTKKIALGDYQLGASTGKPDVVLALPLLDASGEVVRIVGASIGLDSLSRIASRVQVPRGSTLTVVDGNYTILARFPSPESWTGRSLPEPLHDLLRAPNSANQLAELDSGEGGVRRLYAVVPVESFGNNRLFVIIGLDPAMVFADADRVLLSHVWLFGLTVLAALAAASVAGYTFVVAPVNSLADQLRARTDDHAEAVSERRRAQAALVQTEERMRLALEGSGVGVWEANLKTGEAYWSETCEAMHGLAPGTFGKSLDAFGGHVHEDDRERVLLAVNQAVAQHTDIELEYRTRWADGTIRRIVSTAHFYYDGAGVPLRGAGVTSDVTERRSLEEQLRQSQKMEAVGQLAGGVAHDFNNLLTAILGYVELLEPSLADSERGMKDLDQVRQSALRAAQLTRQLLAFSRRQILQPSIVDLNGIVSEMGTLLRRLIGEDIELQLELDAGLDRIKADPGQIEQVVMNLAVNARDAMPSGGSLVVKTANVRLDDEFYRRHGVRKESDVSKFAVITVTDTGTGMDAATKCRIFEPFFTTKAQGKGTGLGLATVYGIVKQSGGFVHVDSEPGQGTSFRVYLPSTDEEIPVEFVPILESPEIDGTETILLVEDEESVRMLTRELLERRGYRVIAAADAEDAIKSVTHDAACAIDLLLTDVVMPGRSGPELFSVLRPSRPELKVLYLSGYTDDVIVRRGVLDADVPFMHKPFTANGLVRKVREVLTSSRAA